MNDSEHITTEAESDQVRDADVSTAAYPDGHLWVTRRIALKQAQMEDPEDYDNKLLPRMQPLLDWRETIEIDYSRNALHTEKGMETLSQRYYARGETDPQHIYARVACAGADNAEHARRIYGYISKHWFMPATPVLTNLGTDRGLPISCFLQHVPDSLKGIISTIDEAAWMGARGGGIGTYWGELRSIGESIGDNGATSGVIPFLKIEDSLTQGINQGGVRRGSAAVYLPVWHPEIIEFVRLRDPTGDYNRRALNLHHGVCITDEFMQAVRRGEEFTLRSPKDGTPRGKINARELFQEMVEMRLKTGEPYMLFIDTVNKQIPAHHKKLGLLVSTSNLCSEITLPTGRDHKGRHRSAVCCLSSMNLVNWDEWKDDDMVVEDVLRFLDNVMTDFILRSPEEMRRASYSAWRERSVGLGVMGFHTFLQRRDIPWESAIAKSWNMRIFKLLRQRADAASVVLADERGACPDAVDAGVNERFSCKIAIAPTASISTIAGGASPGIEPIPANVFNHKTLSGNHEIRNPDLERKLEELGMNNEKVWTSIIANGGSIQHLVDVPDSVKDTYKTAWEIPPRWILEFAADRTPYIDQAQSLNLFIPPEIDKWDLMMLHYTAWQMGIKSLYYLRSKSIQRAGNLFNVSGGGDVSADNTLDPKRIFVGEDITDYEECLACQ
jgi:ribonucleoside-diphosphate reductase alpha chain